MVDDGDEPPPRAQRWRHWAYSLFCAHDSMAIADLDVPWWTYGAIDAVEEWLASRARPVRVFEWGSGASTMWLAKRVDQIDSVEQGCHAFDAGTGQIANGAAIRDQADADAGHWRGGKSAGSFSSSSIW